MLKQRLPRVVLVTRPTLYELAVRRHGTAGQAKFFAAARAAAKVAFPKSRSQHDRIEVARDTVRKSVPSDRRVTHIGREDLDRFLFEPDDIVVAIGQDGLVPNIAKYLSGQPLIGINPDPAEYDGVLCRHDASATEALITWATEPKAGPYRFQDRAMAQVELDDGQKLLALNEVFVGHRTHQSARYTLLIQDRKERQSSSGLLCSTGTGSTGWALSILVQRGLDLAPPAPEEPRLLWFVREPFPSVSTGVELTAGEFIPPTTLGVVSEMGEGGVVFADGIESDFLEFPDGQALTIRSAPHRLRLVVPTAG